MKRLAMGVVVSGLLLFGVGLQADTGCFSTHSSGSWPTRMTFCISQHGNVAKFESPQGMEHLRVKLGRLGLPVPWEGYMVCSGPWASPSRFLHGYDMARREFGLEASTISQPNGVNTLPLEISRETTDGVFRLKQTFSRDTAEHDLTVAMTLTNIGATYVDGVSLERHFDGDSDRHPYDTYSHSERSVWGQNMLASGGKTYAGGNAFGLTALTFNESAKPSVMAFSDWNPDTGGRGAKCHTAAGAKDTPTSGGDFVGVVEYGFSRINAGQSWTVKFVYRRF
jgi:hypothetical protein